MAGVMIGRVAALAFLMAGLLSAPAAARVVPGKTAFPTVSRTKQQGTGTEMFVTIAARQCPLYTDISPNRARNNIMESLRDLRPGETPYAPGQPVDPITEANAQPNCTPLYPWRFTLGRGIAGMVSDGWGSLSIVSSPFTTTDIVTQASVPLLDTLGRPTGDTIAGATTIELTPTQLELASSSPNNPPTGSNLWIQGGTPQDPILHEEFPDLYGFGALRCALDNLNGDNVEWIAFPASVRHVFCFAYYVTPPPTAGTIIVRKEVDGGTEGDTFNFGGNVSFNPGGAFTLTATPSSPGSIQFIRGETKPGEAPWTVRELGLGAWDLESLACTSRTGQSTADTNLGEALAEIRLAAEDTVTCTFTDRQRPPPPPKSALEIRKVTHGGVGRFGFTIRPVAGGGQSVTAIATTQQEGVPATAEPGELVLDPGQYEINETPPRRPGGHWSVTAVECDGMELPAQLPARVTLTAGTPTVCTVSNTLVLSGSIALYKVSLDGTGTSGFLVTPTADQTTRYSQRVTTVQPNVRYRAHGDSTRRLPLGSYVIEETDGSPGRALGAVICNGELLPFSASRVTIHLTPDNRHVECVFVNVKVPEPDPDPEVPPPPPPPVDPSTDIRITKTVDQHRIQLGQILTYTIHIVNHGNATADLVVVRDQLNVPAVLVDARPSSGHCDQRLPLNCVIRSIDPGKGVTIVVRVRPLRAGVVSNTVVSGLANVDPRLPNNRDEAAVKVVRPRPRRPVKPPFTG